MCRNRSEASGPKIEIPVTPVHRALDLLGLLTLIGLSCYLFFTRDVWPETLPVHYNGAGEPDGWGSRTTVWNLFGTVWLLYIGITAVERFPSCWNTGVRITEKNRECVYRALKNMLVTVKTVLVVHIAYLIVAIVRSESLGRGYMPLFLSATLLPILGYGMKIYRCR